MLFIYIYIYLPNDLGSTHIHVCAMRVCVCGSEELRERCASVWDARVWVVLIFRDARHISRAPYIYYYHFCIIPIQFDVQYMHRICRPCEIAIEIFMRTSKLFFNLIFSRVNNRLWSTSDSGKRTITTIMSSTKLCIEIYNRCCSQRRSIRHHYRHRHQTQNSN